MPEIISIIVTFTIAYIINRLLKKADFTPESNPYFGDDIDADDI